MIASYSSETELRGLPPTFRHWQKRCFELGLSMNIRRRPERGSVWRIAPPLTVTTGEIDRALDTLDRALRDGLDTLARAG